MIAIYKTKTHLAKLNRYYTIDQVTCLIWLSLFPLRVSFFLGYKSIPHVVFSCVSVFSNWWHNLQFFSCLFMAWLILWILFSYFVKYVSQFWFSWCFLLIILSWCSLLLFIYLLLGWGWENITEVLPFRCIILEITKYGCFMTGDIKRHYFLQFCWLHFCTIKLLFLSLCN